MCTPLVVRIVNTWSLHMLHRDVYIRPWLLMPKQHDILTVNDSKTVKAVNLAFCSIQ